MSAPWVCDCAPLPPPDFASSDLASSADLSMPDLASPADLSVSDLATTDGAADAGSLD